jgi:hypothetical protein
MKILEKELTENGITELRTVPELCRVRYIEPFLACMVWTTVDLPD